MCPQSTTRAPRRPKSEYVCPQCGQPFMRYQSQVTGSATFCSLACRIIARRATHPVIACRFCGCLFEATARTAQYCSPQCANRHHRGPNHHNWQGGRDDYVRVAVGRGRPVKAHRKIMADHLGRALSPTEIVHHRDGNKRNNALDNLVVMTRSEHGRHHQDTLPHPRLSQWARTHTACTACSTTTRRHMARGLCTACYARRLYHQHGS